jgi:hypothetical protein
LKLGSLLSAIAEANGTQLRQLNLPPIAPHGIPRVVVPVDGAVLHVGLDRVQLSLNPPEHIRASLDEVFEYAEHEIARLLEPISSESWMQKRWAGVIVSAAIPTGVASLSEAAKQAAEGIVTLDLPGTMKTFQLQVGSEDGGLNKTFTISGYETRTAEIQLLEGESAVEINDSNSVVDEAGVRIVVDINNRPHPSGDNVLAYKDLIRAVRTTLDGMASYMNLRGVTQ